MKSIKYFRVVVLLTGLLVFGGVSHADDFTLTGPATFSGQGFGTLVNLLVLQDSNDAGTTEIGAVAPTNADNLGTLGTNFGGCGVHSGIDLCGEATNTSDVVTAADLAALGITSTSSFGLLYNVNQEGSDLNTFLNSPTPFTVYFYDADGNVLFSASYAGTTDAFPPAEQNGQGSSGYLFVLGGTDFATHFDDIAFIGMSGTINNANDGPDGWSVVNAGGANPIPEPATMVLLGTGLLGVAGKLRRRMKKS